MNQKNINKNSASIKIFIISLWLVLTLFVASDIVSAGHFTYGTYTKTSYKGLQINTIAHYNSGTGNTKLAATQINVPYIYIERTGMVKYTIGQNGDYTYDSEGSTSTTIWVKYRRPNTSEYIRITYYQGSNDDTFTYTIEYLFPSDFPLANFVTAIYFDFGINGAPNDYYEKYIQDAVSWFRSKHSVYHTMEGSTGYPKYDLVRFGDQANEYMDMTMNLNGNFWVTDDSYIIVNAQSVLSSYGTDYLERNWNTGLGSYYIDRSGTDLAALFIYDGSFQGSNIGSVSLSSNSQGSQF
jgi:hypothetical protein